MSTVRRGLAGLAATCALLGATGMLPAPHPAVAAQDEPDDPAGAEHLVVVGQTPWVVPGGAFAMRLRVDDAPDGAQVRMALHRPVGTRSAFVRSLDGDGLRSTLTEGVEPLDAATVDDDGSIILRIITGPITGERVDVELDAEEEGVYPVVVELLDAEDTVVDRLITHLVRLPDPDPEEAALGTVVVVPLHAPPSHTAPGELDVTALAQLDVTIDALLAHPGLTLTLLPTPEALAGAVEADPAAAGRVDEVVGARTAVARPWARLDPVAWRRAGLRDELLRQIDAGGRTVLDIIGAAPDSELAVIPGGGGRAAVDHAVDAGAGIVLVPEADLEPLDEGDFPVTLTRPFEVEHVGGETLPALMVDTGLQARIGATGDAVLDAHRLLADLAVLALDAPLAQRAAVVVLDDEAAAEPAFLEAFLGGLDQPSRAGAAPLARTAGVREVLDVVEPAGSGGGADAEDPLVRTVLEGEPPPSLTGLRDDLAGARAAVGTYRSVFGADDRLAADVEELILTAGASSLTRTERSSILAAGTERMQARLDGIHGPVRQRVTLTAREGQVQLVFGNDTEDAADVLVELQGDRLEFPDQPDGRLPVHLEPGTTRVELKLRARSSGDAPLDLRITTPDGRVELGRSRVTVFTTAFSGVGLVLMGAAALFLVVWWTRTFLRERGMDRRRHPANVGR